MLVITAMVLCSCTEETSQDGLKAYVLRWRSDLLDKWSAYEITDKQGLLRVEQWITSHREAIARVKGLHLAVFPTWELYRVETGRVEYIRLLPKLPEDPTALKAQVKMIENIPTEDLEQLRSTFQACGKTTTWKPGSVKK